MSVHTRIGARSFEKNEHFGRKQDKVSLSYLQKNRSKNAFYIWNVQLYVKQTIANQSNIYALLYHFFLKCCIYLYRGKQGGRKRGRGTSMWETNIYQLSFTYTPTRDWATTQRCALTGNWTSDLLVCRMMLNPLSHSTQGSSFYNKT